MSSPSSPDPYTVLGVSKSATSAEIRSSYKKLVLKFHPDKIQDEAERLKGQDVFQKVQEAYELLSDEVKRAKHDQKARLAELKKEVNNHRETYSSPSPRPSGPSKTEYRKGRVYEERVPSGYRFFEDDVPYSEEPRPASKKHDGYEKKSSTKDEDRKKSSTKRSEHKREHASSSGKERVRIVRESERSSRSDRAKNRDRERRRETSEKYKTAYVGRGSDSDDSYVEILGSKKKRESRTRSSRPDPLTKPEPRRYEESDYVNASHSAKFEYLQDHAREYIQRTKANNTTTGNNDRSRPPSSPYAAYIETARLSPDRPHIIPTTGPSNPSGRDRRGSADVDAAPRSYISPRKIPNLVSSTSAPSGFKMPTVGVKVPPPTPGRAATASHLREHREPPSIRRSETLPVPNLSSRRTEPIIPRPKAKDLYDSGYSSPGTPEMHQGSSPKSSKYTIVDECEDYSRGRRTVLIDPTYRHQSTSPSLREATTIFPRSTSSRPIRPRHHEPSRTMPAIPTIAPNSRPSPKMRSGAGRESLYGEATPTIYPQKFADDQVRYSRRFGSDDIAFGYSPRGHRDLFA